MAGKKGGGDLAERAARITKKAAKKIKGAPKSKRPGKNNSPSRQKYWASGRLAERKIKRIMRNNGLTRAEASVLWHRSRKGRVRGVVLG